MDACLSLWLGQEGHAECPKIGPEQEVEGVEGVRPSCSMLHIVLAPKLSLRCKLHPTVIEKAIWVDLSIILRYGERGNDKQCERGRRDRVSLIRVNTNRSHFTMNPVMYVP